MSCQHDEEECECNDSLPTTWADVAQTAWICLAIVAVVFFCSQCVMHAK